MQPAALAHWQPGPSDESLFSLQDRRSIWRGILMWPNVLEYFLGM